MESILINPKNTDDLKMIKAILKALKIPFTLKPDGLPPHVIQGALEGLKQFEEGKSISAQEFMKEHFTKKI